MLATTCPHRPSRDALHARLLQPDWGCLYAEVWALSAPLVLRLELVLMLAQHQTQCFPDKRVWLHLMQMEGQSRFAGGDCDES